MSLKVSNMNVLLSGVTGFIGGNVLSLDKEQLINRCIVRAGRNNSLSVEQFVVDNIDENTYWGDVFEGIDSIIHLAGIAHNKSTSQEEIFKINTLGTLKLAKDAALFGVKRFVFVSTASLNDIDSQFSEQTKSKLDAEIGLKKIAKDMDMELVIIRPALVYGLNAPGNVGLLTKCVNFVPFLPFYLVENKRDFIAVQNLADLLLISTYHPGAPGHTFLASDGKSVSTRCFTNAIAKGLSKSIIQLPIPISMMRLAAKLIRKPMLAEQLLGNLEVDASHVKKVLGWIPPYTMEQAMSSLSKLEVECKK